MYSNLNNFVSIIITMLGLTLKILINQFVTKMCYLF
jgi:hypothetical protein